MRIFLTAILLFLSQFVIANKIDSLKTDDDILNFFNTYSPTYVRVAAYQIVPASEVSTKGNCPDIIKEWGMKSWEKADFNNDGLTDILISPFMGKYYACVFIDSGNDKYNFIYLTTYWPANCQIARTIMLNGKPSLMMYTSKQLGGTVAEGYAPTITIDTLTYAYGIFAERNTKAANEAIDTITLFKSGCLGACPSYEIKISSNGDVILNAGKYNPKLGKFRTKFSAKTTHQFLQLINYLNVKKLEDKYQASWTDAQSALLTVKFKDGTVKKIYDYGCVGTYGLYGLYKIFDDLRLNENWE